MLQLKWKRSFIRMESLRNAFINFFYIIHSTYYLELEKENIIYLKGLHKVSVQIHFFFD